MKRILQKTTVFVLLAVCLSTLAFMAYVDRHFYETRPRQPDLQSGRIYPELVHGGTRVYITHREKLLRNCQFLFFAVFAVTAFSGAMLNQRWKVLRDPRDYGKPTA